MIAGLPLETWVLTVLAVVPGVALALVTWRIHRHDDHE